MSRKGANIVVLTLLFIIMVTANIHTTFTVTWSASITRMTTELIADELPSIIQTNDGRIWVVWAKAVMGDRTLFYKTSSDLGVNWSEEKSLTYIPEVIIGRHDTHPSIIQAADGTIWLVYHSNKPPPEPDFLIDANPKSLTIPKGSSDYSTISIYSLMNFSEPVGLSAKAVPSGVSTTFDPNPVTPPPQGVESSNLTISVDITANPGNYLLTILGKSENKSHLQNISLEITNSTTTTLSNGLFSTYSAEDETHYEIYYKTSNDNGVTWSNRFQLTNNTNHDLGPSIVQLANGTIMIVYGTEHGSPATGSDILYNATSDGTSWVHGNITAHPGFDKGPSIMQAEDEKIWVAWASDRSGHYQIFLKIFDGLSWSNATQRTNSTGGSASPSILQTHDGTIWLFYQSGEDIYYEFSTDNGGTWSNRTQFTTDNNDDLWPDVTQVRDTKIWVAWTSNRADQPDGNWDIYLKASLAGDVNEDGAVDVFDLTAVAKAYASVVGGPGYDLDLDITKDGRIDMRDIAIISKYYGST